MGRRSRSRTNLVLPTNAELPILEVLWEKGEGTVQDVVDLLASKGPRGPSPNYKTVQSILRIMEDKSFVQHKRRGRAFVFVPRVERDEVQAASARGLLDRNFQGSYAALLVNLLDRNHVKEQELDELEALIQRYRERRNRE